MKYYGQHCMLTAIGQKKLKKMAPKQLVTWATGFILILTVILWSQPGETAGDKQKHVQTKAEIWFQCEFAHSRIPPEDNCHMLDDDGFLVVDNVIFHIKISDSDEASCRGQRFGHCFQRSRKQITVSSDEIGPIIRTENGFAVDFLGCTQKYRMISLGHYVRVTPDDEQCYWTPDKHYYVTQYKGRLISADE